MTSKLLYRELKQTELECVPNGVHEIGEIYRHVKETYPELCDDSVKCNDCCTNGAISPEWQHRVRTVLCTLKGKGRIDKIGLGRGYWRITVQLQLDIEFSSGYSEHPIDSIQLRFEEKFILDACCGGRQFWYNNQHPHALYMDIRQEEPGVIKQQLNWCVQPDIIGDYRDMEFDDETFHLVVWDIPHILKGDSGIMTMKYGSLGRDWKEDTLRGFNECWRVLKPYGILNFKWNDVNVRTTEMISLFPEDPLYGALTKKGVNNTFYLIYMKIPEAPPLLREILALLGD